MIKSGSGAVWANTLLIPKPALSARNLLAASSETADSSRDNPALRNDNLLKIFQTAPRPKVWRDGEFDLPAENQIGQGAR